MTDEVTLAARNAVGSSVDLVLRVKAGADAGSTVALRPDRAISVGVSPDNDFRLNDRTVSRYHLEVQATPAGALVRDLGSSNGTFLGRARIEVATLPADVELSIGETTLVVENGTSLSRVAPPSREELALPGFIAASPAMRRVALAIQKLGPTSVSVLIEGETGTGKEVVAAAIHASSPRAQKPFLVVDCGALPPTLIASELFGHERGAFTGASRRHVGAFERAAGGTLFLDEIGELPLDVQPSLLGALERRRFRRVGGEQEVALDVRVISATNRDLRSSANSGAFRADLYFRLAVSRLVLPPLRQRPEDIPALVEHFATQLTGQASAPVLDERFIASLMTQYWSGNVRELRNVVESAIAMGEPEALLDAAPSSSVASPTGSYREARALALSEFERSYVTQLIHSCNGNASEAARRAKMDRPYLLSLLKRHGLR
ncbi:MAG: sigma 54-interacting transcriptional regulator [Polyangiaceae bacterium]